MLQPRAGRHPSRGVAPDEEGQQQRYEQPDKGGGPTFGEALASCGAEDGAHYTADYAAEDQPGSQGGQPAEHHAYPASAPVRAPVGGRGGGMF
jgi:hypothetical protein